ncbi:MAG: Uma2 family endonuclease [Candidatus Tectomicrobia bacterium]|nr:Uma2 family endonuclease [Candidatus Tectomicrobia bacterium]
MTKVLSQVESLPLIVHLQPVINLTDDQFFEFCQINRDLRIERTAQGELLIMPPAGGETGGRNSELNLQLRMWAKRDSTGVAFDSSTGFTLPNRAMRSPDAAWVKRSRLAMLTREQKKKFLPLCPDFVIELRSPSDTLRTLHAKMREYMENGAQLGWLIDPEGKQVYIYRPQSQVERLENPMALSGDPVLPGFVLDLQEIWETGF